ncbi:glycosyltransferase family 4 protein [Candidatus Parcubacteria bacterium]|nr:glycosyltransferase family 4 protein [Candidatus Parcubacteria bacterium]
MKKNIAILFPVSRKMGIFQYSLTIAEALAGVADFNLHILYFGEENPKEFLKVADINDIAFTSLDASGGNLFGKIEFIINWLLRKPVFVINKKNKEALGKLSLDLLILPFPILFGFEHNIPYIVTIPDIMHKYYPGFPEYDVKTRIKRDMVYALSAQKSVLSVTESSQGTKDLNRFYHIPEDKIRAIYLIPPGYLYTYKDMDQAGIQVLLGKYNLPEKFIFYPAQFWFHKNHVRLIESINIVQKKYGQEVHLVLAGNPGANNKNYQQVMGLAEKLGIAGQVHALGYVTDEELVALYKKSTALVYPTLIGPTNIPPLEAMVLGVPVLCSDLFSMPEQLGGAGVLFDPFNSEDMAEKIHQVWTNEPLRKTMIEKGYLQLPRFTSEKYGREWVAVVKEALAKIV